MRSSLEYFFHVLFTSDVTRIIIYFFRNKDITDVKSPLQYYIIDLKENKIRYKYKIINHCQEIILVCFLTGKTP